MFNNVRNWFGLPFLSANISGTTILSAGNTTTANGYFYPETAQPQFQLSEYDFWDYSPIPGSSGFSTSSTNDLLIVPVGSSITVNSYAKLAVLNGYSGVYGYLGQYFTTNAYALDSGGSITTNTTGILSPYGNFFATEPGPAALVTLPDIDTGQQGTGTVYCVSVNVDKNHDGTMDLSFNGADATSQSSPMVWWINNDHDYSVNTENFAHDDPGKDIQCSTNTCDYANNYIDSQRDLEDFARLWICGMPALTNGSCQVTLCWANVGSGSPAINLFRAVETNGGIAYLTDTNIALSQINQYGNPPYPFSTVGPGIRFAQIKSDQTYTFPATFFTNNANKYFLFEGAGIGSGELMLTISQNGNTIAQTGVWLDLHDVKDFYELAEITNNISGAISNWTSGIEIVQPATASGLGDDTNLIVLVHGINVGETDWWIESDTVFKRLYWAGYHGKFATVKWPCEFFNLWTLLSTDTSVFNRSEVKAYKASTALAMYLAQLRVRFPNDRLNILAHSQGNAITSIELDTPTIGKTMPTKFVWRKLNAGTASRL